MYPNSLLARSMKARYYPKTSVWESNVDFNPSFVWRSIWSSTLNLGVRWRVGNGSSIKVWSDAWLEGNGSGKIISPLRVLNCDATVASLFDRDNNGWDMDIINDVFLHVDVQRIRQVPISTSNASDERICVASDDVCFYV